MLLNIGYQTRLFKNSLGNRKAYYSQGSTNERCIVNYLIGLNEVEVVGVFVVVLVGKDARWEGNVWGKEQLFARNFADVGKMWGKLRNRKSLKSCC